MLAEKTSVRKLIPQEPPMLMVDSLIEHEGERTLTGFSIKAKNIFLSDGLFSESGIIENMAQSAALRTGWAGMQKSSNDTNFNPPIGVIGSVKNFKLFRLPEVNTRLETEILVQAEVFSATVIQASVRSDGELLAEAELKIFIQE